jgi:regulatory protein
VSGEGTEPLTVACGYINARERTAAEVEAKLARSGFEPEQVRDTIEKLRALGYVDDARYARLFVADKRLLEAWGSERIGRELARRGIERDLIGTALEQKAGEEGELERAVALIQRRWKCPPRDRRERDRALGVLLRKGYDSTLALEALETTRARRA